MNDTLTNIEEKSDLNLVRYLRDELTRLQEGNSVTKLFTVRQRRKLRKRGITMLRRFSRKGGGETLLTEKGEGLLKIALEERSGN